MRNKVLSSVLLVNLIFLTFATYTPAVPISEPTQECIDCHATYTPGLVEDWRHSRHAQITPAEGMIKTPLERRISSVSVPEKLQAVAVGCYECHGLNPGDHADNFEHFGYEINIIVSPEDCRVCHAEEAAQFAGTKKAHAVANLRDNPLYHSLVESIIGPKSIHQGEIVSAESSTYTQQDACFACHGSTVEVVGTKTIDTELGEIEVPDLRGWPNQGVGRENPDGSRGSCAACHPRHSFSIAIARQPQTCSQCHLAPDVPAWNVYRESKHGNIVLAMAGEYDWEHVPWTVGADFRAPTCATCHNALLVSPEGDKIIDRSHDFGARLWVRLFGLIYSHAQPDSGATYLIKNADGLPLPTTFGGEPAREFLIDDNEQVRRRQLMASVCRSCHGPSWVDGHFTKLDSTIAAADQMVQTATILLQEAWENKLADATDPFDEPLEHQWIRQWLFYANSVRYASAMSGPDYAAFKNGWWNLSENLAKMQHEVELLKAAK